jgi:hypothetical protein
MKIPKAVREEADKAYKRLVIDRECSSVSGVPGTRGEVEVYWCALTQAAFVLGYAAACNSEKKSLDLARAEKIHTLELKLGIVGRKTPSCQEVQEFKDALK